ncbi:MAG: hypothetical protein ACOY82_16825 [Pseudomonadota bacterium]
MALVLGGIAAVLCFALWAANGLPYQDPTPEMLKAQELRGDLYGMAMLVSVLMAAFGAYRLLAFRRRPSPDRSS